MVIRLNEAIDDEITKVVFRKDKHGEFKDVVTAIFPDLPANYGRFQCFDVDSGHGECSLDWYYSTVPATQQEYKDVYDILVNNYGYNLKVVNRIQSTDRNKAWYNR